MKLTTLFFLFAISSCAAISDAISPDLPSENDFFERFPANKKGIVLLQLNSSYSSTKWCKTNLNIEAKIKSCFKLSPSNSYKILMLEPGWYEILGYEVVSTSISRIRIHEQQLEPEFSNITGKRRTKPLIGFEVIAGKISFLGQIKIHDSSSLKTQIKDDDFDKISTFFFKKNYQKLYETFKESSQNIDILTIKINDSQNLLIRNLAKNKTDLTEEKKVEKLKIKKLKKTKLKTETFKKLKKYEN